MKMKRVLAGAAALAMCVGAVPAVYSSPAASLCAYAADTALTNGNISISTEDEAFAAASVEVTESWFADNDLPEWTEASNVKPMLSLVQGDNGFTADIDLKDQENADYEYKGDLKITYELPDSWDLSGGVSVCYAFNGKTMFVDTVAYLINDVEISGNTITFTLPYDSLSDVTEGDETDGKVNATRLIIMENSKAADFSALEDGVYDVGLSMFQNVEKRSLSMAANTMYRKAKLIVKDGKYYFNLTFNTGIVMYSPAFCNKIYAMDLSKSTVGDHPVYGVSIPGIVTEYFDDDYVKDFTFDLAKTLYAGMGVDMSDEELRAMVEPTVLQNGIKYIKNVTLDVTDSIQEDNTVQLGFCSDIMDSFYDKGVAGSDNGFNTTNVMLSAPVKTTETAEDVLPAERDLDLTKLEPIFEKCINTCDTNIDSRKIYTKDSFNTYFVPAWSMAEHRTRALAFPPTPKKMRK
ncbi:MAG: NEAT domain-containing protein [Ruminococcus sp.]|nr:NEAT domain-containing protein [Ruminococcus sp.]